jgi:Protein of unknown function (DUF2946)
MSAARLVPPTSMLTRVHLAIGSFIGLFAVLMATLAPTISHLVAASRFAHSSSAMHSMHGMHEHGVGADESAPHSATSDGDDCGYCSLFVHLPAVPAIEVSFVAIARAIQHRKATRFESVRRHELLTSSQPRAPPVSN